MPSITLFHSQHCRYRKLVARPQGLSAEWLSCDIRTHEDNVTTQGELSRTLSETSALLSNTELTVDDSMTCQSNNLRDLRLSFELDKSCYATMLVHALGHCDHQQSV